MLKAIPVSWISWNYRIIHNSKTIAEIDLAWIREEGKFSFEESNFKVSREKLLSGDFILQREGAVIARAEKTSPLFRSFEVEADGKNYTIDAASALGRKFHLKQDNRIIGSVQPEHPFTRKAIIDLPEDIAMPTRIFIVWLILILWRRESN